MQIGKAIRTERIFNRDTGRTIIVPLDHGVTVGPIQGLIDARDTVTRIVEGGANAVLMHKGLVPCGHRARGHDIGLVVHLSASTVLSPSPGIKTLVCSVEEAIQLGADAISLHLNLGDEFEREMLAAMATNASALDAAKPLLRFVAKGATWIEVRDAKGDILLRRTLVADETVVASGDLPLSVVVGKVDLTVVEFRGKVLNLEASGPDNVARFKVQ